MSFAEIVSGIRPRNRRVIPGSNLDLETGAILERPVEENMRDENNGAEFADDPTKPEYFTQDPTAPARVAPQGPAVAGSGDVSTIPAEDRMRAVIEAAGEAGSAATLPSAASEAMPRPRSAELMEERNTLSRTEPKDKNGRFKSMLLNMAVSAGRGAEQALSTGRPVDEYAIAQISGRLLGGGAGALIDPALDEKRSHAARMDKLERDIGQQLELERQQAQIEAMRAKRSPDALATASYTRKMREATARLRAMGTYTPGRDKVLDGLVAELGLSPKRGGAGGGFNTQKMKVVGGNLVYVEHPDLPPVVLYTAGMSEADRQRNAIALEQVNTYRARNGEPPLMFAADLEGEQTAPSVPSGIGPHTSQPAPASAAPVAATAQPAPSSPVGVGSNPVLVPVPGAKAPAGIRARYRRGRRGSARSTGGASSDRSTQIANGQILSTIRDFEEAKVNAANAARRGRTDESREHLQRARAIAQELKTNPNTAGFVEVGEDAQGNPYVKRRQQRSHASINRVAPGDFDAAVKRIASDYDVDEDTARSWLEGGGYAPR